MVKVSETTEVRMSFNTVAALLADASLTYANTTVSSLLEAEGFVYEVAASGASDHHITTAGGVKLYVKAGDGGYNVKAFGATGDGTTDDTAAIQKALNEVAHIWFPVGTYRVTSTLTADKSSLKMFGEGEYAAVIKADAAHSGGILLDLGNTTTSRYGNEIRNLGLDGNNVASLKGIRLRRINNQSKIVHNHIQGFDIAIEADSLALANVCAFNKFGLPRINTINIKLIDTAGNSWRIQNNYFAGGQIYLNNSMTDVELSGNAFDGSTQIYTDGVSGPRGCHIFSNRFETTGTTPIDFGVVRGMNVTDNYFTGSSAAAKAVQFRSNSAVLSATITNNWFELFTDNFVDSSLVGDNKAVVFGNRDDNSASTPYNMNPSYPLANGIAPQSGDSFAVASDRSSFGTTGKVVEAYISSVAGASGAVEDLFTITTPTGAKGGFLCEIEAFVDNVASSTAVAALGAKAAFVKVQGSGGASTVGAVTEVYETASAASASGTRDVTGVVFTVADTSDGVATVQAAVTYVGVGAPNLRMRVKIIWDKYSTAPTLAAV